MINEIDNGSGMAKGSPKEVVKPDPRKICL
jgi:hypothetical protein